MALQVVHGNQGLAAGGGEGLGRVDPDQQGADQAGLDGDRDRVDPVEGAAGVVEGGVDDGIDQLEVPARGHLRDDPAEPGVQLGLRGDHGAEHARAIENGGAGVVAGRLDREDPLGLSHLQP